MTTTHLSFELESELIGQFTGLHQELLSFLSLLQSEADAIKQQNLSQLESISEQKNQLSLKIDTQSSMIAQNLSKIALADFFKHPDAFSENPTLITTVNKTFELTTKCHDLNLANGMSIQILSNFNQQMLRLFKGNQAQAQVYGASGNKEQPSLSKTTLGKA